MSWVARLRQTPTGPGAAQASASYDGAASGPGEPAGISWLTPDAMQDDARHVQIGGRYARTFTVTGYPRHVTPGWFNPLLTCAADCDISLGIDPVPLPVAVDRLRRQLARLEASRRHTDHRARLPDPTVEAAAADATDLADRLARGETRLFRVTCTFTVHATTLADLEERCVAVRAVAASLLLSSNPLTFRQHAGWESTRPFALPPLAVPRTMDTAAAATLFPHEAADPPAPSTPTAVLYGTRIPGGALLFHDRWAQPNHNSVLLARSGAGKSYLAKLDLLRNLYAGVFGAVVDPDGEYSQLAAAVDGTVLTLGAPTRINPLALTPAASTHLLPTNTPAAGPAAGEAESARLMNRVLFVHTLIQLLVGDLDAMSAGVLDRALLEVYRQVGITPDPATHHLPPPHLVDLLDILSTIGPAGEQLADGLRRYLTGSHAALFSTPTHPATTVQGNGLLVVNLAHIPDELHPVGCLLAVDLLWQRVRTARNTGHRSLILIDEAWRLMAHPAGAQFLFRLAKTARKAGAGLSVVSQDAPDLLSSDLGRAVIANAATHILLGQAPQALPMLTEAFALTDGQQTFLRTAGVGDALLCTPTGRTPFRALASPDEHPLLLTNPHPTPNTNGAGTRTGSDW